MKDALYSKNEEAQQKQNPSGKTEKEIISEVEKAFMGPEPEVRIGGKKKCAPVIRTDKSPLKTNERMDDKTIELSVDLNKKKGKLM